MQASGKEGMKESRKECMHTSYFHSKSNFVTPQSFEYSQTPLNVLKKHLGLL